MSKEYSAKDIVQLDPRDHIRKRPGMYIGGTGQRALHHMVYIGMDHSVERALNERCRNIQISFLGEGKVIISDDSEGISVKPLGDKAVPFIVRFMTEYLTSEQLSVYQPERVLPSSIIASLDYFSTNALSTHMEIENKRDGYLWHQQYEKGRSITPLKRVRRLEADETTGVSITFVPDDSIFDTTHFDYDTIASRCKRLSHIIPGLQLRLQDERDSVNRQDTFFAPLGLTSLVEEMAAGSTSLQPVVAGCVDMKLQKSSSNEDEEVCFRADFAFQLTDQPSENIISFCNTVVTPDHGTHMNGLREGIRSFSGEPNQRQEEIPGLVAAVSIFHPEPSYAGRFSVEIINPEVGEAVRDLVLNALERNA